MAGVIDTFSGRYQLNEALLASALADSEKAVNQARDKSAKEQLAKGESFIAEFRKKKGIKNPRPASGIGWTTRGMKRSLKMLWCLWW